MDSHFLQLLVCPLCNSALRHDQARHELVCQHDQLAYPIRNGIPVMLPEEARSLNQVQGAKVTAEDPNEPVASSPEPVTPDLSSSGSDSLSARPSESGSATAAADRIVPPAKR